MLAALRFIMTFICMLLIFSWGIVIGLLRPFHANNVHLVGRLLAWVGRFVLGIEYEVRGREKIGQLGAGIFISNHQSNFDIFSGGAIIPERTVTLGKKELFFFPIFGLFYWLGGNIFIDRTNQRKAFRSMRKVKELISEKKTSLWMMPEGTRSKGRGLLPFKKGAFYSAVDAQAPVTSFCFSPYYGKLRWNRWHTGKIIIQVLDPVSTQGLTRSDIPALIDRCHREMRVCIEGLDSELAGS